MKFLITFNFSMRPAKRIKDTATSFREMDKKAYFLAKKIFTYPELNQLNTIEIEEYKENATVKQNTFDYL